MVFITNKITLYYKAQTFTNLETEKSNFLNDLLRAYCRMPGVECGKTIKSALRNTTLHCLGVFAELPQLGQACSQGSFF